MENEKAKLPAIIINKYGMSGKMLPSAAATAVNWNNRLDRRLLTARRTASAITMPATGAINMVKNPIQVEILLPINARMAAIANATK